MASAVENSRLLLLPAVSRKTLERPSSARESRSVKKAAAEGVVPLLTEGARRKHRRAALRCVGPRRFEAPVNRDDLGMLSLLSPVTQALELVLNNSCCYRSGQVRGTAAEQSSLAGRCFRQILPKKDPFERALY